MIKQIEKRIIGKMIAIRSGKLTPKDSNVGILFNKLKTLDEALYIDLIVKYKDVIQKLNQ